jgi:hypothetical protein
VPELLATKESRNSSTSALAPDRSKSVARWFSIVGHPFTFILILVLVPFLRRGQLSALRTAGVIAVAVMVPFGLFVRQRHRNGHWQTVDASSPSDRPVAYVVAFAAVALATCYSLWIEHSPGLVHIGIVMCLMLAAGAALNSWIKGSGHMTFACFVAVLLLPTSVAAVAGIAIFIPFLAWSRLKLGRHTLLEVLAGCAMGLVAGWAALVR